MRPPATASATAAPTPATAATACTRTPPAVVPLPAVPAGNTTALRDAVANCIHLQTHAHTGRYRLVHVQLLLSRNWQMHFEKLPQANRQKQLVCLCNAIRQSNPGLLVNLMVTPAVRGAELRLQWAAWEAPPVRATHIDLPELLARLPPHTPAMQAAKKPMNSPTQFFPPPTNGVTSIMSFLNPLKWFAPANTNNDNNRTQQEPRLAAVQMPEHEDSARHLSSALKKLAQEIVATKLQILINNQVRCSYRLYDLTVHVTPANQPILRGLMEIQQNDPKIALHLVKKEFAQAAKLLNTDRFNLLTFRPSDSLPEDCTRFMFTAGRDTIHFGYTLRGDADITSGEEADTIYQQNMPFAQDQKAKTAIKTENAPNPLYCWLQLPGQDIKCWVLKGNATVGASPEAHICIDLPHVSGKHLQLTCSPETGTWAATDVSRHGANAYFLFDATASDNPPPPTEVALEMGKPTSLPHAGCLRIGPKATHPLLHFVSHQPPRQAAQMAVDNTPDAGLVKPARRQTAFDI